MIITGTTSLSPPCLLIATFRPQPPVLEFRLNSKYSLVTAQHPYQIPPDYLRRKANSQYSNHHRALTFTVPLMMPLAAQLPELEAAFHAH